MRRPRRIAIVASSCVTCTSSQSVGGRFRARQHGVDDVERRQIDDARLRARGLAHGFVLAHDVFARHHDDEFRAAVGRLQPRHVGDLRVLDAERRGLAHLPPDQLVEVARARRAPSRSAGARPWRRRREWRARRASGLLPMRSNRRRSAAATAFGSRMFGAFSDGTTTSRRQRLHGVRRDRQRSTRAAQQTRPRPGVSRFPPRRSAGVGDRKDLLNEGDLVDLAERRCSLRALSPPPIRAGIACPLRVRSS